MHLFRQLRCNIAPLGRVPPFGCANDVKCMVDVHERRQALKLETLHERPVRIGERQEFIGHWAKKLSGLIVGAGNQPGGANVGRVVGRQDPSGGVDNPGAFMSEWIENHNSEVEGGDPVANGARVALERVELDLWWGSSSHGVTIVRRASVAMPLTPEKTDRWVGDLSVLAKYCLVVHPIERLRYVARATHVPADVLARETAMALADFVGDDAGLLIACRRILDRQPSSGALVWLAAHVLGAPNQRKALWDAVEQLEDDRTPAALAYSLPDDAVVAAVCWNDRLATLARKRGDLSFVIVDTDGNAEYQIDRYADDGQSIVTVDAEAMAQGLFEATHLLMTFDALGPEHGLVPIGTFPAATVARHLDLPVWGVASVGVALGERMYGGLAKRWNQRSGDPRHLRELEEVPVKLVDQVVTTSGAVTPGQAVQAGGCPIVAELF